MTLTAGTRLGPYEIVAPLGAGGMGEVYRARDPRLGREVAVKVLPEHLSLNPEVRARFEREAKTVSSLNHPHICTLYDVGREGETDYLVMELVEGETLAARLAKGALPPEQVLKLGVEIADALDRAHRAGIVHRDLKPGNVMMTKSGAKLMDFGLARATGMVGPAGGSGVTMAALTQSPTVAAPLTAEGTIVGTYQYMAPEQLEGKEADERSDLWALGCVLYEASTGKRPFEGRSQASLIAAILERVPAPVSTVQPMAPPALDRVIQACLAKDPDERIQTAHDVKLQLQWIAEGGSQAGVPAPVAARRRDRERIAWTLCAVFAAISIASGLALLLRPGPGLETTRFVVLPEPEVRSMTWPRVSPDGLTLAFSASDSTGRTMIWVRPLSSIKAVPLAETEGAGRPFWSPDSRHLGFISNGQLKKIPAAGGPPQLICEAKTGADGAWGSRGVILFDGSNSDSIRQVSAEGGVPTAASTIDRKSGEFGHAWPSFLPDGRHFLYLAFGAGGASNNNLRVGDIESRQSRALMPAETRAEYASPGYVLLVSGNTLMARPFDCGGLKFTGEPFPIADHVQVANVDRALFSVSQNGVLTYLPSGDSDKSELVWMDRGGRLLGVEGPPAAYRDLALSPDGSRLAYGMLDVQSNSEDIWVRDLARGVASRLTFEPHDDVWPVWSPDGSRIVFASNRSGPYTLFQKPSSGAGVEDSLHHRARAADGPSDWSRDGRWIVFQNYDGGAPALWVYPMTGDAGPYAFLSSRFAEDHGRLSPDGRWLAYSSNESGRREIYVQAFPGPGGKWQVSANGGSEPEWRADGKELFFVGGTQDMMAVAVNAGSTFEAGVPARLFQKTLDLEGIANFRYTVTADGQRFLLNAAAQGRSISSFLVVMNWPAELKKK